MISQVFFFCLNFFPQCVTVGKFKWKSNAVNVFLFGFSWFLFEKSESVKEFFLGVLKIFMCVFSEEVFDGSKKLVLMWIFMLFLRKIIFFLKKGLICEILPQKLFFGVIKYWILFLKNLVKS